ncbi:MAG: cytochrome c oxidase assembly protein [Halomonadaceae bacterium]|nr:MAG: cytochrome c oxidase assembly protein [Halomonadaceae bacterium]
MHLKPWRPRGWVLLAVAFFIGPRVAGAHNPISSEGQEQVMGLLTGALLAVFWGLYLRGCARLAAGWHRGLVFHGTTLLCVVTLLGPLDGWAKTGTAAHMTQHMLLMVVIAPLWVLSRPLPQIAAGGGRRAALLWRPLLALTRHPLLCAYLHGIAIWFWHAPLFYNLALKEPLWHTIEHASFLGTAGLFWWSVLNSRGNRVPGALLALLVTLMHTGFLGALLTFAQTPLYQETRDLQDQQLAGLIMWVPGAIPYLVAALWLGHRWLQLLMARMTGH